MNALDAITLCLIVAGVILGWRSGAIPQVFGLIGAILGGAAAIIALPYFEDPLSGIDPTIRPIVVLAGLVVAVGLGESLGGALGRALAGRLGDGLLSTADRTAGSALAVAQALLVVWLAGSLLAEGPIPRLAETPGNPPPCGPWPPSCHPPPRSPAVSGICSTPPGCRMSSSASSHCPRHRSTGRPTGPPGPSRRRPRPARSRSRPRRATGSSRSAPGSPSPGATSSRMPTSSPAPAAAAYGSAARARSATRSRSCSIRASMSRSCTSTACRPSR